MPGYEPVDLSIHRNAGSEAFVTGPNLPTGAVLLRGLPFRIGEADGEQSVCAARARRP